MLTPLILKMLNKEAAAPRSIPGEIIRSLQIREGDTVADIGSGGGYFTLQFTKNVEQKGQVYAIDTQSKNLDFIKRQSERQGLNNIVFVLATGKKLDMPDAGLDLVFVRNAFHHLPEPATYFRNFKRFLKPTGKVATYKCGIQE